MSDASRILVVINRVRDYQIPLIQGMETVLRAAGISLLVVVRHPLDDLHHDTMLRRMVISGRYQGLIVTGMTDAATGLSRVGEIVGLAQEIPCVTMGEEIPGHTAILPDNDSGVRAAMAHLLDDCGRTAPLLVAGPPDNPDSCERELAFLEVASERRLSLPRIPLVHAGFVRETAYRRMVELLRAGRDFDAVVAASDDMAIGVLDALHEHGVRVPEDVAVVGFDNTNGAKRANPSLSSVDAQLEEQGKLAVRMLLQQLSGVRTPDKVRVSANLVVRRSSSAGPLAAALPALTSTSVQGGGSVNIDAKKFVDEFFDSLPPAASFLTLASRESALKLADEWLPRVVNGEFTPQQSRSLGALIHNLVIGHPESLWWTQMLTNFQNILAAASPDGRLTHATRAGLLGVALHVERAMGEIRGQRDRRQLVVIRHALELGQALGRCRSLSELTHEIAAYLPRLKVNRCFLVLFDRHVDWQEHTTTMPVGEDAIPETDTALAQLAMSYQEGIPSREIDPEQFSIHQLLPASLGEELDRGTLILQPLFSDKRWFGILLHEQRVLDRRASEALRRDISDVLEVLARANELEALVARRTAELDLEIARRKSAQKSLQAAVKDLRRAVLMDGLTGLQNRPSFDEHFTRSWHRHQRRGEPLSVLMVDVDHFKLYNDTYGHLAGDECLRQVAACLRLAVIRKQDVVARYGGEEFAIILPDTGLEGARLVGHRLLAEIRSAAIPHSGSTSTHQCLSVSVGIASTATADVHSPVQLLERADRALYEAKRNGRDRLMIGDEGE